jgi:AcrR family transcriptional regulator
MTRAKTAIQSCSDRVATQSRDKADQRKSRILRAAAHLISRKSYLETTMDEIAEAAKVSKGGMYYYFPNKSDVLFHILDQAMDDLMNGLEEELARLPDGPSRLRRIIERQVDYYADNLAEAQTLLNDRKCLHRERRAAIEEKEQRYFDLVRAAVAESLSSKTKGRSRQLVNLLTFALFGMCNWIPGWFKPNGAVSIEQLADMTFDLYLNGLNRFGDNRG